MDCVKNSNLTSFPGIIVVGMRQTTGFSRGTLKSNQFKGSTHEIQLSQEVWFHGPISRKKAEDLLKNVSVDIGWSTNLIAFFFLSGWHHKALEQYDQIIKDITETVKMGDFYFCKEIKVPIVIFKLFYFILQFLWLIILVWYFSGRWSLLAVTTSNTIYIFICFLKLFENSILGSLIWWVL